MIRHWRAAALAFWLAAFAASLAFLPDLGAIVRQRDPNMLPADAETIRAAEALRQIRPERRAKAEAVLVFARNGGLTDADRQWLNGEIEVWRQHADEWGIAYVSADEAVESKDGSVRLLTVGLRESALSAVSRDALKNLRERMQNRPAGTEAYWTGDAPIFIDLQDSAEAGLHRTEALTVALVIVILLIVFRSPVAPLVPLATIGLAFVISRGLVGLAAERWDLPVSNYTQSFLVAVLFGAGTDYCILLMHRFREELSRGRDVGDAVRATLRSVGKTVVFAALTVLIAFSLIGFSQFGLYRSAVGVSIGMAVALTAVLTFAPAVMALLGRRLFWPVRVETGRGHRESRFWDRLGALAVRRPAVVLIVALAVTVPFALTYRDVRSFDQLSEIDPSFESVQGFQKIEQAFGSGEIFPVTAVVRVPQSLRSPEGIAAVERVSAAVAQADHVVKVRSASRPAGVRIEELSAENRLDAVRRGVDEMAARMQEQQPKVGELAGAIGRMTTETRRASDGLAAAADGLGRLRGGAEQLGQSAAALGSAFDALLKSHPELANDPRVPALSQGLRQIGEGARSLANGIGEAQTGVRSAADGLGRLADGQRQAADGAAQLENGLKETVDALKRVSSALADVRAEGWNIPPEAWNRPELQKAFDVYLSPDGTIARFDLVLDVDPYSKEAMRLVDDLRRRVAESVRSAGLRDAEVTLAGIAAQNAELDDVTREDFRRTGAWVLFGIAAVLALMLRSAAAPVYILLSLGLNYLVTAGLLERIFVDVLGEPGLSWAAPFFVFLALTALSVDYGIFLLARLKEEQAAAASGVGDTGAEAGEPIRRAMAKTGGVITSAAVILAGTFSAFLPSGVVPLMQIGSGIVVGLALYTFVFLGFAVPALIRLQTRR